MASGFLIENSQATVHEPVLKCSNVGFNLYEESNERKQPAIAESAGEPQYGMITTDSSRGLRALQARPMIRDSFNSGCVSTHPCVSADGFTCGGAPWQPKEALVSLYSELNALQVPEELIYTPPPYMMGIKNGSVNSVTGWQTMARGYPADEGAAVS